MMTIDFIRGVCMFQVIVGHGEPAPRLCNKDPFALKSLSYLAHIFPKGKFVLMLRDGRATVHSMISRKVRLSVFSFMLQRPLRLAVQAATRDAKKPCHLTGFSRGDLHTLPHFIGDHLRF